MKRQTYHCTILIGSQQTYSDQWPLVCIGNGLLHLWIRWSCLKNSVSAGVCHFPFSCCGWLYVFFPLLWQIHPGVGNVGIVHNDTVMNMDILNAHQRMKIIVTSSCLFKSYVIGALLIISCWCIQWQVTSSKIFAQPSVHSSHSCRLVLSQSLNTSHLPQCSHQLEVEAVSLYSVVQLHVYLLHNPYYRQVLYLYAAKSAENHMVSNNVLIWLVSPKLPYLQLINQLVFGVLG